MAFPSLISILCLWLFSLYSLMGSGKQAIFLRSLKASKMELYLIRPGEPTALIQHELQPNNAQVSANTASDRSWPTRKYREFIDAKEPHQILHCVQDDSAWRSVWYSVAWSSGVPRGAFNNCYE